MKIKRIITISLIILLGSCFITGCKKKETENIYKNEPKTVVSILSETFEKEIKTEKNIEKVAQKIADSEVLVPEVQIFTIGEEDYLSGFKEEIKGFKKAIGIAPMINTIPMIVYIFEVEDSKSFSKTLEENADLRWNICTEADEMKTTVVDDYVFFIMSPTSFEE